MEVTLGRYGQPARPGQAIVSLRILRISLAPAKSSAGPPLAWVGVDENGDLTPKLFVSLPAVTSAVSSAEFGGYQVRRLVPQIRDELLARAVGRAAAHELGHYLLQRGGHRSERTDAPGILVVDNFR